MSEIKRDIRILHIRGQARQYGELFEQKGGMTIAYEYNSRDSFITLSTAICSKRDFFNRKTGNKLAMDAFNSGKTIRIPYNRTGPSPSNTIRDLFENFYY